MCRALLPALLLLLPTAVLAAEDVEAEPVYQGLMHARSLGMGGAFRAQGLTADAVQGNPAALGLFKAYRMELSGGWDPTRKAAVADTSVLDSITSPLAAGYSYHYISAGRGEARRTTHLNSLAFTVPLGTSFFVGAAARYVLTTGALSSNAVTADAGMVLRLGPVFHLGLSGHNLIDIAKRDFPRYWVGSLNAVAGTLSAAVDVRMQPGRAGSPYSLATGGEAILGNVLPVRAGWAWDMATQTHSLSAGLGILVPGGGVDIGYQQGLFGRGSRQLALTLKLQTE